MTDILPLDAIRITATSAVSCLGSGAGPHLDALRAGRSGLRPCDYLDVPLPGHIGRVDGLEATRLPQGHAARTNRATQLTVMAMRSEEFHSRVARAIDRWGSARFGLVVGTTTSGVALLEELYRARRADGPLPPDYVLRDHNDHHAVAGFLADWLGIDGPVYTISTACSSSAKAIIDATQLIRAGVCDAVLAGGVDSLCRTSLHGFDALELVSRTPCRPFDAGRDGLSIGEGAGFVLLERGGSGPWLSGYGESSDAISMSTPPADGSGALAAMRRALARAGLEPDAIGFVKLHGTATRNNDASEGAAVAALLPTGVPAASFKGMIGHTLGAAGALEPVLCLQAMAAGIVPGNVGLERPDPEIALRISPACETGTIRHALCNAFGFGGSNCALILTGA